jgi:glutamate N-acetyltransferase/amino-acid N-acetyltransferase
MTTDPFPKEAAAQSRSAGASPHRRHGQGLGHDRADDGDDARLRHHRRAVPKALLDRALRDAVDDTFNAITVDGECSTNDCVMLLANGASGAAVDEASYPVFLAGLDAVCRELALGIVRGGEGATKLVTVQVTGGATSGDARRAAKAIANSLLVKTAIHGGDPNWGRLIAVAGRAGVAFELSRAAVRIGSTVLFKDGRPYDEAAPERRRYLAGKT